MCAAGVLSTLSDPAAVMTHAASGAHDLSNADSSCTNAADYGRHVS